MNRRRSYKKPQWLSRCHLPLSEDCSTLQVTSSWAVQCFKSSYHQQLALGITDPSAIAEAIAEQHMPFCHIEPVTPAEIELRRRMTDAAEALLKHPDVARGGHPLWLAILLDG